MRNFDILVGNKERLNLITLKEVKWEKKNLFVSFKYKNLRNFSIDGFIFAKVMNDYLKIQKLSLDSDFFSAEFKGTLGKKQGTLDFSGVINPIDKRNFALESVEINGKVEVNLPFVYIHAKAYIPSVKVREKKYINIEGNINGYFKLFEKLMLNTVVKNPNGIHILVYYTISPDNFLKFSFKNIEVDRYTLGIPLKLNGFFKGQGFVDFKNKKLQVIANTENLKLEGRSFRGSLDFSYRFAGGGTLTISLEGKGKLVGKFELLKKEIKGGFTFENFPISYKGFKTTLKGEGNFIKKENEFSLNGEFLAENSYFQDFKLDNTLTILTLKDKNINVKVFSGKSYGVFYGKFNNIEGFVHLKNYKAEKKNLLIKVKKGKITFKFVKNKLYLEGQIDSLKIKGKNFTLETFAKIHLKKERNTYFKVNGSLDANILGKIVFRDFHYSSTYDGKIFKIFGNSQDSELKLHYDTEKESGNIRGFYRGEFAEAEFTGIFLKNYLEIKYSTHYNLMKDKLSLKGIVKRRGENLSVILYPCTFKGKTVSYRFKGFDFTGKGKKLFMNFKGIEVKVLNRKVLEVSSSEGTGTLNNFEFKPFKLSGILNGEVNLIYRKGLLINSRGYLDLSLLSKHMGSLLRGSFHGKLNYSFEFAKGNYVFRAKNDDPVKVFSQYFYQPFDSAMSLELDKKGLRFVLTGWFKEGFINAYTLSENLKDFNVEIVFNKIPLKIINDIRARILADGRGSVKVKRFKEISVKLDTKFDGYVKVKKIKRTQKREKEQLPVKISLDINFETNNGIIVRLPEGRLFTAIGGRIYGKFPDINYKVHAVLRSGILNYFGKTFFVRMSEITAIKGKNKDITKLSLNLNTVEDNYKIFLSVRGTIDNPEIYYFSEPPLSRQEILLRLIGGGSQEGVLPVADAILEELKILGTVKGKLEKLLDLKVDIGLKTENTGEMGAVVRLKKNLGRFFSVYYQVSTTKDKRDTFLGGEVKFPVDMDVGFRFFMYSDNTTGYKLRYVKEFDF